MFQAVAGGVILFIFVYVGSQKALVVVIFLYEHFSPLQ